MAFVKKKQYLSKKEAFLKAGNFCAYQERTQQEVKDKLIYEYGQTADEADEIVSDLIEQNFINEERFAKAFAGGKFRMKKWGRIKIEHELKQRGLSAYCIRQGLKEISEADYLQTLYQLIEKKEKTITLENPLLRQQKLARFALTKGYENDLVWKVLKDFE
ncbi:MAG: RecX family transcriptional regulator [Verrucomicrobia bacterium]|nr:RecX family transcriptional regulator [Cytophagales bacterium]